MDRLSLFRALRQMGHGGHLSRVASGGDDPLAAARRAIAEIRKLWGQ